MLVFVAIFNMNYCGMICPCVCANPACVPQTGLVDYPDDDEEEEEEEEEEQAPRKRPRLGS